jgi:hypothetical protein
VTWDNIKRGAEIIGALAIIVTFIGWLATRASASDVFTVKLEQAAMKANRDDDSQRLDYVVKRLDGIGEQLNHFAASGRMPIVPAPPPPVLHVDGGAQ